MRTIVAAVAVLGVALLACKSETTGTVTVNGAPFEVKQCRSGQANTGATFSGISLFDDKGNQIRFAGKPEGGFRLFHFAPGQPLGTLVGEDCGTLVINQTNTQINGVYNVEGSVSANCTGSGFTIIAALNYAACH
ncbi:MAG: hypothetical protein KF915_20745 [Polyangiaceae bacterium]|nr:hypothetical protein [Polyangiaceae bacterium]